MYNSFQTSKNRIAVIKRLLAEVNLKDRLLIVNSLVKVNLHHVNLVQVRVQCQTIIWIHLFSFFLLYKGMNVKYLSAWVITYLIYLPWVFIGNLGLKSYGEWAQKKFEQDMDELETME